MLRKRDLEAEDLRKRNEELENKKR